jgi:hypothetical protein
VAAGLSHSQGINFAVPSYAAADYVRNVRRLQRRGVIPPAPSIPQTEKTRPPRPSEAKALKNQ